MTAGNGLPCKKCGTSRWNRGGACVACHRERNRRWDAANPEKAREAIRRWKMANPERVRDDSRRWSEVNREKKREQSRRSRANNPEVVRALNQKRRAQKAQTEGHYTAADWKAIVSSQGGKCLACGKKTRLTVDHIVPLSKGGTNWPENLQGLCGPCNSSKGSHHSTDYREGSGIVRWIQKKLFG